MTDYLNELIELKVKQKETLDKQAEKLNEEIEALCLYNTTHTFNLRTLEELELRRKLRALKPKIEALASLIGHVGIGTSYMEFEKKEYERETTNSYNRAMNALSSC